MSFFQLCSKPDHLSQILNGCHDRSSASLILWLGETATERHSEIDFERRNIAKLYELFRRIFVEVPSSVDLASNYKTKSLRCVQCCLPLSDSCCAEVAGTF